MSEAPAAALSWFALALASCHAPHAPLHEQPWPGIDRHEGETFMAAQAHYGIPILRKSLFWDGEGEVDDSGIGVQAGHFLRDSVAVGGMFGLTNWWTGGRDVYSAELEGLLRIYPWSNGPVFLDGTGGFQQANDQIPPGGTMWNFTFGFGGGVDLPVTDGTSVLLGAAYHHISNALGRENDRNPSQNEVRFWVGFGWTF